MRHHFVPQFLISEWSNQNRRRSVAEFRLDLPGVPVFERSTKSVAFQDDLYALTKEEVAGMSRQSIEEKFLSNVDNEAAIAMQTLRDRGLRKMNREQRICWVRFLMSLQVRQPNIVTQLILDSSEELSRKLEDGPEEYSVLAKEDDPISLSEWVEARFPGLIENFGLSIFPELVDNKNVGDKLLGMRWWLWDFSGLRNHLVLADHPCIFTAGIDEPDLIVALPIGPTKAFLATRSHRASDGLRRQDRRRLLAWINERSISQAVARVFAMNESPRRFIANRVRTPRQPESRF